MSISMRGDFLMLYFDGRKNLNMVLYHNNDYISFMQTQVINILYSCSSEMHIRLM